MAYTLIDLPYDRAALAPHISAETLDYHYGKHHQTYVDKTNAALEGQSGPGSLIELVKKAKQDGDSKLFNNAAQIWNHNFYWLGLAASGGQPSSSLQSRIDTAFGSTDEMLGKLKKEGADHFASGWAWLVLKGDELAVTSFHDADAPIVHEGVKPLLTLDVWEHAYYVDYRNARPKYLDAAVEVINWEFVEANLDGKGADRGDQTG